ncbi:hypothetical protein TYRP_007467 [Tyrophagus putrescentiae]|nr:hypothetical protein TYRP_007467 [Tyrophagus putrescentiae]
MTNLKMEDLKHDSKGNGQAAAQCWECNTILKDESIQSTITAGRRWRRLSASPATAATQLTTKSKLNGQSEPTPAGHVLATPVLPPLQHDRRPEHVEDGEGKLKDLLVEDKEPGAPVQPENGGIRVTELHQVGKVGDEEAKEARVEQELRVEANEGKVYGDFDAKVLANAVQWLRREELVHPVLLQGGQCLVVVQRKDLADHLVLHQQVNGARSVFFHRVPVIASVRVKAFRETGKGGCGRIFLLLIIFLLFERFKTPLLENVMQNEQIGAGLLQLTAVLLVVLVDPPLEGVQVLRGDRRLQREPTQEASILAENEDLQRLKEVLIAVRC